MTSEASRIASQSAPNPQPIIDLATGFMRAKHLFVAGELGIFEKLADGPATLEELAARLGTPRRTTRIIADAVTALGLLERHGDKYRNTEVAQAYLSGRGPMDMRPFIRFWNRLSYKRWVTLEDSVRKGQGVAGEIQLYGGGAENLLRRRGVFLHRPRSGSGSRVRLQPAPARSRFGRGNRLFPEVAPAALSAPAVHVIRTVSGGSRIRARRVRAAYVPVVSPLRLGVGYAHPDP